MNNYEQAKRTGREETHWFKNRNLLVQKSMENCCPTKENKPMSSLTHLDISHNPELILDQSTLCKYKLLEYSGIVRMIFPRAQCILLYIREPNDMGTGIICYDDGIEYSRGSASTSKR